MGIFKGERLPPRKSLLALDRGDKVTGLAICDPNWQIASSLGEINSHKFTVFALRLMTILKDRQIGGIVIGIPLSSEGTIGKAAQKSLSLASNLRRQTGWHWPIDFQEESFSTQIAETRLIEEFDLSRQKRDRVIDRMAAQIILQDYIDRFRC